MRKLVVVGTSALALALAMSGTAAAQTIGTQCPTATSSGTTGSGLIAVDPAALTVFGSAPGLGYGESDLGTAGTNVTYSGELAGAVGHGEVENGSVGTSGASGSADGSASGLVEGSGTVNTSSGSVSTAGEVAGTCVSVSIP